MKEQIVKEWIERGNHDLEVAKILLSEEEYFDVVLFHIHQAVDISKRLSYSQRLGIKEDP